MSQNNFKRFTWPIFVELLLNFCVGLFLYRLLGRIADAASGAIGSVGSLFSLFSMFFLGLSQAGGILIANSCGRGNDLLAARQRGSLLVIFLGTIGFILLILQFGRGFFISNILGLTGNTAIFAHNYCQIAQFTLAVQAVSQFMTAIYRSHGNSLMPLMMALLNNVVTLVFLLLVPDCSGYLQISNVSWIALCQLSGNAVALLVSLVVMKYGVKAQIQLPDRHRFSLSEFKVILILAGAVVLEPLSYSLAQVIISRFFAMFGDVALAARAYAGTLSAVPSLIGIALGWGAQIKVSYLIGAGKSEEAHNEVLRSCRFTIILGPLLSMLIFYFSTDLMRLFTADSAVINAARILLGCFVLLEIGRSCNTTVAPALKARNDAAFVARSAFVVMVLVSLPLAWFLSFPLGFGILGLGLTAAFDELLRGYLNLRRWKKKPD